MFAFVCADGDTMDDSGCFTFPAAALAARHKTLVDEAE